MSNKHKFGVILSGCGVYDGSEIHEAVLTLLAIDQHGGVAKCYAPNIPQHHVINHLDGSEMAENRNVLIESARIARGEIEALETFNANDIDALIIPGGFGAAKNLTKWAFSGADGEINEQVKNAIIAAFDAKKPIGALCMGPTVVAKALEGKNVHEKLTVGTVNSPSPYNIAEVGRNMDSLGAKSQMAEVFETIIDKENLIVSSPCYMMEGSIAMINKGIQKTVKDLIDLLN